MLSIVANFFIDIAILASFCQGVKWERSNVIAFKSYVVYYIR